MAGAIAHHFNNQLFVVMGNLELAMEGTFGLSIHSRLEQAMISLHKATELSSRMLTYLGINNRGKQRVDLSAACRTILNQLRATKPDQVDLVTDLPASGPMLMANHDQLRELLTNLVENSWEAMANRPGTIRLSLATVPGELIETDHRLPRSWQPDGDDYVCLQIEDSGCGMGPEDLERIFDPFYTNKFLGRGIGLPMVLGIARAHGGCVTVDSTLGVGTQVRVYLPIKLQQA
jgi:signal transduction histidine kinase